MYWDMNNLYGRAKSQKLPAYGCRQRQKSFRFDEVFLRNYNEYSDKGYIPEVDVKYSKNLWKLLSDILFLPEKMKMEKCNKLVCNLCNKKSYVVHIKALPQTMSRGLELQKVRWVIELNQKTRLRLYIDQNTELKTKALNDFEK